MKLCSIGLSLLAATVVSLSGYSQGGSDSLTMAELVPQQAVKLSPLHLINFYPTIQMSFEQKVASHVTMQVEGGYVLNYNNDLDGDYFNKRGGKAKLEGRYYFFGRTDKQKMYYVAGEVYYNFVNFNRNATQRECFDIECEHEFIRTITGKMAYREKGFTIKAGLFKYFGKFFFDLSSGWTIRAVNYQELTNVLPADEEWQIWEIPNEEDRVVPGPYVGGRLGYRIR
ncbi:MAG TPA: hypothetical protein VGD40_22845 [Chryseosolibacter sp.]